MHGVANRGRVVPTECMWYMLYIHTHTALIKTCFNALNFPLPKIGVPLYLPNVLARTFNISDWRARSLPNSLTYSNPLSRLVGHSPAARFMFTWSADTDMMELMRIRLWRFTRNSSYRKKNREPDQPTSQCIYIKSTACVSTREASRREKKKISCGKFVRILFSFLHSYTHLTLSLFPSHVHRNISQHCHRHDHHHHQANIFHVPIFNVFFCHSLSVLPMHQF